MKKKIICLIEDLSSGGAERQLAYLASELNRKRNNVQVWTYYPDAFYLPMLQDAGVEYKYFPEAQSKIRRIFVLRDRLRKQNPDVVIAYLDTACIIACMIKAMGARFKLVVSERNTTQSLSKRDRFKFICYRFADKIVPNSQTQSDFIRINYPNLKSKIVTITNYVDTKEFAPQDHWKHHDDIKLIKLMVAGRIVPQKNPKALIQALKQLCDEGVGVDVTWYGNSYDSSFTLDCTALVQRLGLSRCFRFLPSEYDIASVYPQFDAFCLPSLYEGFSNVLCEAMSCGLPIICSNVGDNSRIVHESHNALLFDPTQVDSIVRTIKEFVLLPMEERQKMARYSREIAISQFSTERFIAQYEQIVNE